MWDLIIWYSQQIFIILLTMLFVVMIVELITLHKANHRYSIKRKVQ